MAETKSLEEKMCWYLQGMQFQTQNVIIGAADLGKLH